MSEMTGYQTLVMIQRTAARTTKTWSDHESLCSAIQYLIGIYTSGMAKRNPGKEISAGDILSFIDRLFDVVAMVYDPKLEAYVAHDVEWIKKRIEVYWSAKTSEEKPSPTTTDLGQSHEK